MLKNLFGIKVKRFGFVCIKLFGIELEFPRYAMLLLCICKKLSLADNTFRVKNTLFYVPNYPMDSVQYSIVTKQDFVEIQILKELDKYIPENAIIIDAGANIGNHTLYWANVRHAKKIYSFEPVPETFRTLVKNIEINNLKDVVLAKNIGLSNVRACANVKDYWFENTGGTAIEVDERGCMPVDKLDNLKINEDRIDFMKIDVECHEIELLNGAAETLKKYKPIIFIESISPFYTEVDKILLDLGYKLVQSFECSNYLYVHSTSAIYNR